MQYKYSRQRGALNEMALGETAVPAGTTGRGPENLDDLATRRIPREVLDLVPDTLARQRLILPLSFDGETLVCAAATPDDIALADQLRFLLAKNIRLVGADRQTLKRAIAKHYVELAPAGAAGSVHTLHHSAATPEDTLAMLDVSATGWRGHGAASTRATEMPSWTKPGPAGAKRGPQSVQPTLTAAKSGGGKAGMFFYTVDEGQHVLMRRPNGTMEVVVGPKRVWRGRNVFLPMAQHIAHPDQFLIVRFRDGRQKHLPGPVAIWFDPREHLEIAREEALQIAAKEAVVAYSRPEGSETIGRRVIYGPALFVPEPGQWLHTFSWHASVGGSKGIQKVANALVFQKLWLMPDQMYHDIPEVRTADDAVLTIRLMIFFELTDIERMLDTTHDPIGDFVNAATSDVVGFTGQHNFEQFKHNTSRLNELDTYKQLTGRASQCGYRINKVVFRGYDAAASLQQMHNQAIEARTRLQLDRATEQQAQDLENYKLDCQLGRAGKRRAEQNDEVRHDLELARQRQEADIRRQEGQLAFEHDRQRWETESQLEMRHRQDAEQREHLAALHALGVDLTQFLTQGRADQVIEVRGTPGHHIHVEPAAAPPQADGAP